MIPRTARNLHLIIMLQLHVQNNFMRLIVNDNFDKRQLCGFVCFELVVERTSFVCIP